MPPKQTDQQKLEKKLEKKEEQRKAKGRIGEAIKKSFFGSNSTPGPSTINAPSSKPMHNFFTSFSSAPAPKSSIGDPQPSRKVSTPAISSNPAAPLQTKASLPTLPSFAKTVKPKSSAKSFLASVKSMASSIPPPRPSTPIPSISIKRDPPTPNSIRIAKTPRAYSPAHSEASMQSQYGSAPPRPVSRLQALSGRRPTSHISSGGDTDTSELSDKMRGVTLSQEEPVQMAEVLTTEDEIMELNNDDAMIEKLEVELVEEIISQIFGEAVDEEEEDYGSFKPKKDFHANIHRQIRDHLHIVVPDFLLNLSADLLGVNNLDAADIKKWRREVKVKKEDLSEEEFLLATLEVYGFLVKMEAEVKKRGLRWDGVALMSGSPLAPGHLRLAWPTGHLGQLLGNFVLERSLFTTNALCILGYRTDAHGRWSFVRDCAWYRMPTVDHLCLPIFKVDYMAFSNEFFKGKSFGTAEQIALNALFIEMARDFDAKHLLDLSSAKLIVSQGGLPKAQALHIYSELHSSQVHHFDLFIPLPDLEDLDLPPVGIISAVAIFNKEGLLRHVHVFITHGSFSKYKKGERSILDLIRGIGMDYVMLSHSLLCLNKPSEYAWGQFSALLIPSGGGKNIGEGFNGLTMWLSSLNVGDVALGLEGEARMAHAVTFENLPIPYRIYMVRMGLSDQDVKEWDSGTIGRSWLSRLHGRCNSIVQHQTQTKQQLSIRGLKAAATRKEMAMADPEGYVEFMERRSAKFRDTMSKIPADVRAKKIKEDGVRWRANGGPEKLRAKRLARDPNWYHPGQWTAKDGANPAIQNKYSSGIQRIEYRVYTDLIRLVVLDMAIDNDTPLGPAPLPLRGVFMSDAMRSSITSSLAQAKTGKAELWICQTTGMIYPRHTLRDTQNSIHLPISLTQCLLHKFGCRNTLDNRSRHKPNSLNAKCIPIAGFAKAYCSPLGVTDLSLTTTRTFRMAPAVHIPLLSNIATYYDYPAPAAQDYNNSGAMTQFVVLEGPALMDFNRRADIAKVVKAAKRSQGNKG